MCLLLLLLLLWRSAAARRPAGPLGPPARLAR